MKKSHNIPLTFDIIDMTAECQDLDQNSPKFVFFPSRLRADSKMFDLICIE